jgi:hypothetical protein
MDEKARKELLSLYKDTIKEVGQSLEEKELSEWLTKWQQALCKVCGLSGQEQVEQVMMKRADEGDIYALSWSFYRDLSLRLQYLQNAGTTSQSGWIRVLHDGWGENSELNGALNSLLKFLKSSTSRGPGASSRKYQDLCAVLERIHQCDKEAEGFSPGTLADHVEQSMHATWEEKWTPEKLALVWFLRLWESKRRQKVTELGRPESPVTMPQEKMGETRRPKLVRLKADLPTTCQEVRALWEGVKFKSLEGRPDAGSLLGGVPPKRVTGDGEAIWEKEDLRRLEEEQYLVLPVVLPEGNSGDEPSKLTVTVVIEQVKHPYDYLIRTAPLPDVKGDVAIFSVVAEKAAESLINRVGRAQESPLFVVLGLVTDEPLVEALCEKFERDGWHSVWARAEGDVLTLPAQGSSPEGVLIVVNSGERAGQRAFPLQNVQQFLRGLPEPKPAVVLVELFNGPEGLEEREKWWKDPDNQQSIGKESAPWFLGGNPLKIQEEVQAAVKGICEDGTWWDLLLQRLREMNVDVDSQLFGSEPLKELGNSLADLSLSAFQSLVAALEEQVHETPVVSCLEVLEAWKEKVEPKGEWEWKAACGVSGEWAPDGEEEKVLRAMHKALEEGPKGPLGECLGSCSLDAINKSLSEILGSGSLGRPTVEILKALIGKGWCKQGPGPLDFRFQTPVHARAVRAMTEKYQRG